VTPAKSGLSSRRLAQVLLEAVLIHGRPLDEALDEADQRPDDSRDRGFAHAIAATTLRRKGEIEAVLRQHLAKPLPRSSGPAHLILLLSVAQLLFLRSPPHAVIDVAVTLAREDKQARHFSKLINAVLRKVSDQGDAALTGLDAAHLNTPAWLMKSWVRAYGEETARLIATSHGQEAALDLTAKSDAGLWAERLKGELLPTGTIRLAQGGAVDQLPGYMEGAWWVQDAAAALPARLLGDVSGLSVLDLCAAPGGKTAELASMGARVTAVDMSAQRMARVRENLERLKLQATLIESDVLALKPDPVHDAVLLDAPCSSTGTIRRHPDLPFLKSGAQVKELAELQARLLDVAAQLVRPGGRLVYCTCSLQPEEGEQQARTFLDRHKDFAMTPIRPEDVAQQGQFVTAEGYLRTLPYMKIGESEGLDGFFAVRFQRLG
jgi:16S rRNA (cytosine967-C5)-methyltransferase